MDTETLDYALELRSTGLAISLIAEILEYSREYMSRTINSVGDPFEGRGLSRTQVRNCMHIHQLTTRHPHLTKREIGDRVGYSREHTTRMISRYPMDEIEKVYLALVDANSIQQILLVDDTINRPDYPSSDCITRLNLDLDKSFFVQGKGPSETFQYLREGGKAHLVCCAYCLNGQFKWGYEIFQELMEGDIPLPPIILMSRFPDSYKEWERRGIELERFVIKKGDWYISLLDGIKKELDI